MTRALWLALVAAQILGLTLIVGYDALTAQREAAGPVASRSSGNPFLLAERNRGPLGRKVKAVIEMRIAHCLTVSPEGPIVAADPRACMPIRHDGV